MTSLLLFRSVALCALLLAGCSLVQPKGEPAAGPDAPAPADYHPVYVHKVVPIASAPTAHPSISIGRIETNDPNRVRIYVHLLDTAAGAYLSGGTASKYRAWWCDLIERINGESRSVKNFSLREVTEDQRDPYAIALVMDHSGSMGEDRATAVQIAAGTLVSRKKPEDALAVVKYDNHVEMTAPLTANPDDLKRSVRTVGLEGFGGMTAIADGIAAGINGLSGADASRRKAVIVFTDGQDNSSTISRDSVIALARRNDVIVCAVDFGYGANADYLKEIAQQTGGIYRQMYSTSEFDDVFEDIYRRLRNYYLIEYSPGDFGVHEITLKLCATRDSSAVTAVYDNTPDIGAIALLNVQFERDRADITQASRRSIDNVVALMKAIPTLTIEVRGHTDSTNGTGDPDHNAKLSQRRAEAVRDALVKRGIDAARITAVGFGDSRPVASNGTEEGRALNRRTEFVVVSR
jgi:outer membrane protein OmpA-like peptidoglycan-associated protein/Mg-chelatase subunit ChlD